MGTKGKLPACLVVAGSLFERRGPGLYHNTAVVFDADGSLLVVDTGHWFGVCNTTSKRGVPEVDLRGAESQSKRPLALDSTRLGG